MALVHALLDQPRRFWRRLVVAHVNHGLRGVDSDGDAHFVGEMAAAHGLESVVRKVDLSHRAARGESLEMGARRLRHSFLAEVARSHGIGAICLAHHADDQVELFLLRLMRGAGGEGLQGMRWNVASPADPGIRVVRPMLDVRRTELRAYLSRHRREFREDISNTDTSIPRNAVRHQLLPQFRAFAGAGLDEAILRAAEITGAEAAHVAEVASGWWQDPEAVEFGALSVAVQRVIVREQLIESGVPPSFELIERLRTQPARRHGVRGGQAAQRMGGWIKIGTTELADVHRVPGDQTEFEVCFEGRCGSADLGSGVVLQWRFRAVRAGKVPAVPGFECFDAARIGMPSRLRHWRPGDRMHPLGAPGSAKLQDVLTNRKVPAATRRKLWLATTPSGEVFWVEGQPPADPFKVVPTTKSCLLLRCHRTPSAEA